MPRLITERMSLDDVEEEVLYTEAALKADPDAEDLLPLTANWLAAVDQQRAREREVRRTVATVDATRVVADNRLDQACTRFGDQLFLDVNKDRNSPRWKQFFKVPVSRFVRTALPRQIASVRAWLQSDDALFTQHKADIEQWVTRADDALVKTRALALSRGQAAISRAEFAEDLTHERDGLEAALGARARERGLDRRWPNSFFRSSSRSSRASTDDAESTSTGTEE